MTESPVDFESLLDNSQQADRPYCGARPLSTFTHETLSAFIHQEDPVLAFTQWVEGFSAPEHNTARNKANLSQYLSRIIALIDQQVCEQLNAILHHQKFQTLEASWRGLEKLVASAWGSHNIKIRLLDVSWREVAKDIDRAADFDQSALFNLIYSQEFGIAGGQPYGVLLGDYQISHRPSARHPNDDINTLRGMAQISAAAFTPFICSGSPELFGLEDFETLGQPMNLDNIFRQDEYLPWRRLRAIDDARFLGITLPQMLMRQPYKNKLLHQSSLLFNENVDYKDSSRHLWGNACYALGIVLLREFADVGWFSHIRGAPRDHQGGGLVSDLPALDYGTDSAAVAQKIVTQVIITDDRERSLSELGFLALCDCYDTPFAVFQSCPSLQLARQYQDKSATANARMGAMLQQVLCASRFAHYIKVMIRDKVGSFTTDKECERMLQNWLNDYTTGRDDLEWDALSRYPLRSARVQVREQAGKPGIYSSIIHLQPHYIVDQLVSELRLTTELSISGISSR